MNRNRKIAFILLALFLLWFVGDTYGQSPGKKFLLKSTPDLDGWSGVRIGAGAGMYGLGRVCGLKPVPSLIATIAVGFAWEIVVDGYQNAVPFNPFPPDPKGADLLGDPVFIAIGAGLAFLIDINIQRFKGKVYVYKGKAYLVIEL